MNGRTIVLYLLVITIFGSTIAERKLHRLVGGHLRITNSDPGDAEFLTPSASGSRQKKQKLEEEEKKTLSQQVADGKYGLIQKELFKKTPKRPGVISYDENPEVPKDNIKNLGGLSKNEIWLAENHLLVIKGGTYPPYDDRNDKLTTAWPAIDDFKAPLRQVKIPTHPKVPPPFPVQLTEDGPLQILGTNSSRTLNGSIEQTAYALPPPEGYEPGTGPYFPPFDSNPPNTSTGQASLPIPPNASGEYPPGALFPPFPLNGSLPPYFASLPPGAAILPPPGNQTDFYDEDDPSIYYPPPYSFYYPKDNSSLVPAGPLVPGIILPPPPDFFAPLDETTTKPRQRKPYTTQPPPQLHPTTTPLPSTLEIDDRGRNKPKVLPVHIPEINNELKPVITTTKAPKVITILPVRHSNRTGQRPKSQRQRVKKPPNVTILRPVKPSTVSPKNYVYNEVTNKPFVDYGPPLRQQQKTVISTTQVPLKIYYSTSNEIETNSVTQQPEKFHIGVVPTKAPKNPVKPPTKFYYYEEEQQAKITPEKQNLYQETTRSPLEQNQYYDIPKGYYVAPKSPVEQPKPQYIYVTARPYNTQRPKYRFVSQTPKADSFSLHIARLQNQIHQYYTTPRSIYHHHHHQSEHSPKPVYQYSFQANNYPQQNEFKASPNLQDPQDKFRPLPKYSVQIQQAVEILPTSAPAYQNTPSPIYYQQNYADSTERPAPSKYYTTPRPDYEYEEEIPQKGQYIQQRPVATPRPITQYSFEATPNPVYQGYYTKPDEGYFDDITKKYFTMFGQKIPGGTTPIPRVEQSTPQPIYSRPRQPAAPVQYQQQQQQQQQQQKPVSLERDTLVNYVNPRPSVHPDSELVQINLNNQGNYPQVTKYNSRPQYVQQPPQQQQQRQQQISNRQPHRTGPEIVKAVPVNGPTAEGQPGSFISYELPGDDGAHFYFLTPQLAQRRDQGVGYFYSQPNSSRVRRNEKNSDKER